MYVEKFELSKGTIGLSIASLVLLVVAAVVVINTKEMVAIALFFGLLAVVGVWTMCNVPTKLLIGDNEIIVVHLIGQTAIAKSQIVELRAIERCDLRGSVRLLGSGGFFGWFGLFRNQKFGNYRLFTGDYKNLYLIRTDKKSYVISSKKSL